MQHLSEIAPRVCTLVLFIIIVCQFLLLITSNDYNNIEANYDNNSKYFWHRPVLSVEFLVLVGYCHIIIVLDVPLSTKSSHRNSCQKYTSCVQISGNNLCRW